MSSSPPFIYFSLTHLLFFLLFSLFFSFSSFLFLSPHSLSYISFSSSTILFFLSSIFSLCSSLFIPSSFTLLSHSFPNLSSFLPPPPLYPLFIVSLSLSLHTSHFYSFLSLSTFPLFSPSPPLISFHILSFLSFSSSLRSPFPSLSSSLLSSPFLTSLLPLLLHSQAVLYHHLYLLFPLFAFSPLFIFSLSSSPLLSPLSNTSRIFLLSTFVISLFSFFLLLSFPFPPFFSRLPPSSSLPSQ